MKLELETADLDSIAEKVTERLFERIRPYIDRSTDDLNEKRLYSIKETAKILGRGSWAVRHMIAEKKLQCIHDGKRVFVEKATIESFISSRKTENPSKQPVVNPNLKRL